MTKRTISTMFKKATNCEDVKAIFVANVGEVPEGELLDSFYAKYVEAYEKLSTKHIKVDGKAYTAKSPLDAKTFAQLVMCADMLPNVTLSMNGQFLNATGDTKPVCKQLKELGFWWNGKNWYYQTASARFANSEKIVAYGQKLADSITKEAKETTKKSTAKKSTRTTKEATKKSACSVAALKAAIGA